MASGRSAAMQRTTVCRETCMPPVFGKENEADLLMAGTLFPIPFGYFQTGAPALSMPRVEPRLLYF
jgi:hypothetical protein